MKTTLLKKIFIGNIDRCAAHAGRTTPTRHFADVAFALTLALSLSHCGGDGKTGSNGTGSVPPVEESLTASGPITTLGPTGVGGTSLDDAGAQLQINAQVARQVSELRLGMFAEAGGTIIGSATNGTARSLSVQSAVVGPITAINPAARTLTVVTVPVSIDQNTILDGFSALSALSLGSRVEVYGLPQLPSNIVAATRINILPPDATAPVEILGNATGATINQITVSGTFVSTSGATLIIGGAPQISPSPGALIAENTRVRVIGVFDAARNSVAATQVVGGLTPVRNDNSVLVLDGVVQSVTAPGRFRLNDTDVDAGAVGGNLVVAGARVQVRGRKAAGVLTASEFRQIAAADRITYVIQGDIANFNSVASFRVRGELLSAATATFVGGTAADLANGRRVRIRAVAGAGTIQASDVTFVTP